MLSFYAILTLVFYFYAERVLVRHFDDSLSQHLSTFTRMTERERDEFDFDFEQLRLPEFEPSQADPGYYQAWDQSGRTLERSPSLGGADLPRSEHATDQPTFVDVRLPNGSAGRAAVLRFWPRVEGRRTREDLAGVDYQVDMMVARSRSSLDEAKLTLLKSFFVFALILPLGTVLIVRWATGHGLGGLNRIAEEISSLRPDNLSHRFDAARLPRELLPVSERLNDLLERLRAAFERERRVTADIAHELRTPLAELRVMAEVELEQKPKGDEYLEAVLAITQQMEHLVTTLLAISRTEAGLETAVLAQVDLPQLLDECWRAQQEGAEGRKVTYVYEGPDSVWIHSDAALLSRVLTNLLSNAVSYVAPGGEIRCDIRREDGRVLLDIGNTTHDLRKEDLPHLFEPLWRKEASRSEQAHHGLGLCLVKAYANLLDSRVVADLPRPDWFQITLDLPAAAADVAEPRDRRRKAS
jgi:two-component system sensor histidine kinase QseC